MPRPNPSPQWQEPLATGAAVAVSRAFLALNPDGGYGVTTSPLEADAAFTESGEGVGVETGSGVGEGVSAALSAGRVLLYTT